MKKTPPQDLAYGRHPVAELLTSRPEAVRRVYIVGGPKQREQHGALGEIYALAEQHNVAIVALRSEQAHAWLPNRNHQGVLAEVEPFSYTAFDALLAALDESTSQRAAPLYVVLDCIQDPHNLGALARSALALGADALIIPQDRAAQVTPAAFRTSAGALAHLKVARVTNLARALDELASRGVQIIGTTLTASAAPHEVDATGPTALVLGNEERGMRPQTERRCTARVKIPMAEIGSLNVSAAGAVCLYEIARQRAVGRAAKKRSEVAY